MRGETCYTLVMSRFREVLMAQFLVDWLSQRYGAAFEVVGEGAQDSHVDVRAYSRYLRFPDLKIQNVTAGRRVPSAPEVPWPHSIYSAIDHKDRKFPSAIKRDLVLLVEGTRPLPPQRWLETYLPMSDAYTFFGIYLVSPHGSSQPGTDNAHTYVHPMKDAFATYQPKSDTISV